MDFLDKTFIKAEGLYFAGVLKDVKKHKDALQPIFEAFTNALESINLDRKEGDEKGFISVKLFFHQNLLSEREFYKVAIEDDGIGFNDVEFQRFNTYKDNRKGYNNKGSGRLQLIHYFQNCNYISVYKGNDGFFERKFRISKANNHIEENAMTFLESTRLVKTTKTFTSLVLNGLQRECNLNCVS